MSIHDRSVRATTRPAANSIHLFPRHPLLVWLLISLVLITGCTTAAPGEQAIRSLLEERRQALVTHDLDRYTAIISPTYRHKGLDFTAKCTEIAKTLATWEQIDFTTDAHRITIQGNSARASSTYRLRVTQHGKILEFAGEEEVYLQQEQGKWKIVGGL